MVPREARVVHARLHPGEHELDVLVRRERLAEHGALLRVVDRLLEASLRRAGRERGDRDAALVEDVQEVGEAAAALAEQVGGSGTRASWNVSGCVSEACQPTLS